MACNPVPLSVPTRVLVDIVDGLELQPTRLTTNLTIVPPRTCVVVRVQLGGSSMMTYSVASETTC